MDTSHIKYYEDTQNKNIDKNIDTISYHSLDTKWIEEFDTYNELYNEDLESIDMVYIYVNKENTIIDIIKTTTIIQENKLTKDELKYLIRTHIINKNKKYNLLSLLQYNFSVQPEDVQHFLRDVYFKPSDTNDASHQTKQTPQTTQTTQTIQTTQTTHPYLTIHKTLSTIFWKQTINIFKPLNALYIVFHEQPPIRKPQQNVTKKIRISHTSTKYLNTHPRNKTYKKYT
jgi:hypothetical protein